MARSRLLPVLFDLKSQIKSLMILKGGSGSGNFNHAGRPGQVGGSGGGGGSSGGREVPRNLTIMQAAALLEEDGHTLLGGESYDLQNMRARYRVQISDGRELVLNTDEIRLLLETGKPPK